MQSHEFPQTWKLFFSFSSSIFTYFEVFERDKPLLSAPTIKTWRIILCLGYWSCIQFNMLSQFSSQCSLYSGSISMKTRWHFCPFKFVVHDLLTSNGRLNVSPLVLSCTSDLVLTHFVVAQNLLLWGNQSNKNCTWCICNLFYYIPFHLSDLIVSVCYRVALRIQTFD